MYEDQHSQSKELTMTADREKCSYKSINYVRLEEDRKRGAFPHYFPTDYSPYEIPCCSYAVKDGLCRYHHPVLKAEYRQGLRDRNKAREIEERKKAEERRQLPTTVRDHALMLGKVGHLLHNADPELFNELLVEVRDAQPLVRILIDLMYEKIE
jgi:hypothetical protein